MAHRTFTHYMGRDLHALTNNELIEIVLEINHEFEEYKEKNESRKVTTSSIPFHRLFFCLLSLQHALRSAGASEAYIEESFDKPFSEVLETLARNNIQFRYKSPKGG